MKQYPFTPKSHTRGGSRHEGGIPPFTRELILGHKSTRRSFPYGRGASYLKARRVVRSAKKTEKLWFMGRTPGLSPRRGGKLGKDVVGGEKRKLLLPKEGELPSNGRFFWGRNRLKGSSGDEKTAERRRDGEGSYLCRDSIRRQVTSSKGRGGGGEERTRRGNWSYAGGDGGK